MFKRVMLWSEFPEKVDWKKLQKLLGFKCYVYLAVRNKKEFLEYKRRIKSKYITLGAWPVLSKREGYWFSGFTQKESIDKLKGFKGMDIKIDLEPPIPRFRYSNIRCFFWLIGLYFQKASNKEYLRAMIYWLAENNTKILANEFPLPGFYLEKLGITVEKKKNITLQMMAYTSPLGRLLMPILRCYNKLMLKKACKQNPDMSASVGLIGPGILKIEPYYKNTEDFSKDLEMVKNVGIKNLAIYSIDAIMQSKNPKEWIKVLETFV